jgi:hypothetical protein
MSRLATLALGPATPEPLAPDNGSAVRDDSVSS